MKKTYTGGCQCGKVRYEAQADIGEVITCNCSRCRKVGPLLSAVAMSDFKLLSGENEMTDYQFNKRADSSSILQDVRHRVLRLRQGAGRQGHGDAQRALPGRRRRRAIQGEEIRRREPMTGEGTREQVS